MVPNELTCGTQKLLGEISPNPPRPTPSASIHSTGNTRFLEREGKPQAIVKRPLGGLPEYSPRVQAGVSIVCSQPSSARQKTTAPTKMELLSTLPNSSAVNCLMVQSMSEASETATFGSWLPLRGKRLNHIRSVETGRSIATCRSVGLWPVIPARVTRAPYSSSRAML